MNYKKLASALILVAVATGAQAEPYIGLGLGKSSSDVDGFEDATSKELTAGLKFNEHFALEASYVDLGEFDAESQSFSYIGGTVTVSGSAKVSGYEASAVGYVPFNEKFRGFAHLGLFAWDADVTARAVGGGVSNSDTESDSGTDPVYGLGLQYNVSEAFSIEGEWSRYDSSDESISVVGIGFNLHFR